MYGRWRGSGGEQQREGVPEVGVDAGDADDADDAAVGAEAGQRVEECVPSGKQPRHQEHRRRSLRQAWRPQLPHCLRLVRPSVYMDICFYVCRYSRNHVQIPDARAVARGRHALQMLIYVCVLIAWLKGLYIYCVSSYLLVRMRVLSWF